MHGVNGLGHFFFCFGSLWSRGKKICTHQIGFPKCRRFSSLAFSPPTHPSYSIVPHVNFCVMGDFLRFFRVPPLITSGICRYWYTSIRSKFLEKKSSVFTRNLGQFRIVSTFVREMGGRFSQPLNGDSPAGGRCSNMPHFGFRTALFSLHETSFS